MKINVVRTDEDYKYDLRKIVKQMLLYGDTSTTSQLFLEGPGVKEEYVVTITMEKVGDGT